MGGGTAKTLQRFQAYVDGAFIDGSETFESIDPACGRPWAIMPAATSAEVDQVSTAVYRALTDPSWAGLTATQRGQLLYRLGDLVAAHADRLAQLETRDTGKIVGAIRQKAVTLGLPIGHWR